MAASISLIKSAQFLELDTSTNGFAEVGELIEFTFKIKNTGDTPLSNIQINDPLLGAGLIGIPDTLAPNQEITILRNYNLTAADIDNGFVDNTATVSASGNGQTVNDSSSVTQGYNIEAGLDLSKTIGSIVNTNQNSFTGDAGDTINYNYTVKNNSSRTALNVVLFDDNAIPNNPNPIALPLSVGTNSLNGLSDQDGDGFADDLAIGATATSTLAYTIRQADVDASRVNNVADAIGQTKSGDEIIGKASRTVALSRRAAIDLVKTAGAIVDANDDGIDSAGDTVNYTYSVKNTGNVTLSNLKLVDDQAVANGIETIILRNADDTIATTLAPNQIVTGTYTETLTQADINLGQLTNIAIVEGTPPVGTTPGKVTDQDTQTVRPRQNPTVDVTKTANPLIINNAVIGDPITYSYTLTNNGSVDLFNVSLVDDNGTLDLSDDITITAAGTSINNVIVPGAFGLIGQLSDLDNDTQVDDLAVGKSVTATYQGQVTAAAIAAGSITNIVVGRGFDLTGRTVTDNATATVIVTPPAPPKTPGVKLEKVGHLDLGDDCVLNSGDIITYTFKITNTGETVLDALQVVDTSLVGLSPIVFNGTTVLNPGDVIEASATYAITEDDICAGFVKNFATVYGNPFGGRANDRSDDVSASDDFVINFNGNSGNGSSSGGSSSGGSSSGGSSSGGSNYLNNGVTVSSDGKIVYGTNNDDIIDLFDNLDYTVYANEGKNFVGLGTGNDTVYGGSTIDVIIAHEGNNLIYANEGENLVIAGNGNNTVYGGSIADWIFTGNGDDTIYANEGNNYIAAGAGDNVVYGGSSPNYFVLANGVGSSRIYNFHSATDKLGLAGCDAAGVTVEAVNSGGYFTRIACGDDVLAELDGVNLTKSQIQFETLNSYGSTSVSFLSDPLQSELRDRVLALGLGANEANAIFG
ncbi:MAG: hypothetical protein RLZZ511_356 [Cyanobacteriota bacterium]|jgi:uncharacterized repeat protein (TIGR01451 family)